MSNQKTVVLVKDRVNVVLVENEPKNSKVKIGTCSGGDDAAISGGQGKLGVSLEIGNNVFLSSFLFEPTVVAYEPTSLCIDRGSGYVEINNTQVFVAPSAVKEVQVYLITETSVLLKLSGRGLGNGDFVAINEVSGWINSMSQYEGYARIESSKLATLDLKNVTVQFVSREFQGRNFTLPAQDKQVAVNPDFKWQQIFHPEKLNPHPPSFPCTLAELREMYAEAACENTCSVACFVKKQKYFKCARYYSLQTFDCDRTMSLAYSQCKSTGNSELGSIESTGNSELGSIAEYAICSLGIREHSTKTFLDYLKRNLVGEFRRRITLVKDQTNFLTFGRMSSGTTMSIIPNFTHCSSPMAVVAQETGGVNIDFKSENYLSNDFSPSTTFAVFPKDYISGGATICIKEPIDENYYTIDVEVFVASSAVQSFKTKKADDRMLVKVKGLFTNQLDTLEFDGNYKNFTTEGMDSFDFAYKEGKKTIFSIGTRRHKNIP